MNAMITDKDALYAVQPLELVAYLRSVGWRQIKESVGNWSIWTFKDSENEEFEVGVPLNRSLRDYRSRMADVLEVLEAVESRSQLQILRDLLVTGIDVVRLRLPDSHVRNAAIPLEDGAVIVQKAKELMLYAASATVKPQSYYPGRRSKQASDYMRRTRLDQTEPGSFVVTILSPVAPSLSNVHGHFWAPEEPFERQGHYDACDSTHECETSRGAGCR